ncbi:hypothetical protein HPB50_022893 [Hyalomma asiaticum]|uniref:Uncharacterized protein n=1 Tax=Hyalomma asiaticum TaxID=266040 RepID=A0ACB7SJT1_HYAAI|nr:hypothetical protein HPB50_022893 [Hyalomma asiaticum]
MSWKKQRTTIRSRGVGRHAAGHAGTAMSLLRGVKASTRTLRSRFAARMLKCKTSRNLPLDYVGHAGRSVISSTERCIVGDHVLRMRTNSLAKESEAREVDATCSLRSRSLPPDSFFGDLELSATGLATPPPLLHTRKPPLRRKAAATRATATTEGSSKPLEELKCEPDNRFALCEHCDAGSPLVVGGASETCAKKDSQRLPRGVFQPKRKDFMKDGTGDFKSFIAGATNTSSPLCSGPKPRTGDSGSTDGTELAVTPTTGRDSSN